MKLNPSKSSYMVFSRSQEVFATRLTLNSQTLEQKDACKILGVWIEEDAGSWQRNTKELCKSAYSRISMLSKLRYVGVCRKDLLEIYRLFVRSRAEYCSVAFHSSLTQEQSRKIENIQKTSLKIIFQDEYTNYESACQLAALSTLFQRREDRSLTFARRCLSNKEMSRFFPRVPSLPQQDFRSRDKFVVNFAHGVRYQKSAIVNCQRQLNEFSRKQPRRMNPDESEAWWREWMAGLDERMRRRREGQTGQGGGDEGGGEEGGGEGGGG